jgi:type VI secretion system secreted protein Hcp
MAAVDYYLKIDGIDGEATDAKHKNGIDVESWS